MPERRAKSMTMADENVFENEDVKIYTPKNSAGDSRSGVSENDCEEVKIYPGRIIS